MRNINAIVTLATRDFIKFLRDRTRILATFIFPFMFIGVLGGSLETNIGKTAGYSFLLFITTGVIGQTLFQSTASGIISLIEDRENDFSQEIFISPISRFSIIFGKILGESIVAFTQIIGIIIFAIIIGVGINFTDILRIIPAGVIVALFGGAFGILVLGNLNSQRAANQIFPFLIFPQFFLAGVFTPIKELPPILFVLSRLAPMTYAVDLVRGIYYFGRPEYNKVVLYNPLTNLAVITAIFIVFFSLGTYLFVRNEKNK